MKIPNIKYYIVYAERHPDYGRSYNFNCSTHEIAINKKKELIKQYVGKGKEWQDGYFEDDWKIEEVKIKFDD